MSVCTIPQLFYRAVHESPRSDMFSHKGADGEYVHITSDETYRLVRAARLGLDVLGVKKGDKVAILSENRLKWALSDLAILCTGALDVPIYPTLLEETIEYILNDCQATVIFVSTKEQANKIHNIRKRLPLLKDVISFDHVDLPDIMNFEKLLQIGRRQSEKQPQTPADDVGPAEKDDICSIIYTSGTTGNPKGVMLTHWNFVSNVLGASSIVDISSRDKALSFLPLSHVLERMAGFYTIMHNGAGIAFAESVDTVAEDMQKVKPTIMVSVPRLYEKIFARVNAMATAGSPIKRTIFFWGKKVGQQWGQAKRAGESIPFVLGLQYKIADKLVFSKLRARTGGRLRFFISGGAPLADHINEFFYAAGMIILEGYGLTETSPLISVNTFENFRIGSIGKLAPGTEVRIADDGEIIARGDQVMPGYYNNPEATAEVLTEDGWFSTGDIGHFDKDGYLYITDRKKDLIVTASGKNIAPQPIENALKKNKFISQVVVIGDKHPYLCCLIVPNFETLEDWAHEKKLTWKSHEELIAKQQIKAKFQRGLDRTNAGLPSFSTIKRFALLKNEFTLEAGELTPTMKIKRRVIQDRYTDVITSIYNAGD